MLVLIPGTLNYFYNLNGRRLTDALRSLGVTVDLATLAECPEGSYDCCILSNITEVSLSDGDGREGLEQIEKLRHRCRVMLSCSLDCASTVWFHKVCELCRSVGADAVLDLGLCDQTQHVREQDLPLYYFLPAGLTPSELEEIQALDDKAQERPIPWTFVGHNTAERVALVDHLVQTVDPGGFVYVPTLAPYTEKGSPHLNQQQFEKVLHRTRYQIWCSHHPHFYMEPERFRMSLLTGGVPIKVVASKTELPEDLPFRYLLLRWEELPQRLRPEVFEQVRRRFRDDFMRIPSLAESLASFLTNFGLLPEAATTDPARVTPKAGASESHHPTLRQAA
ncbi:MAG: hypothetical protein K2R98_11445 [Gemmataceae bacterium]|nr:hypothetical protein [Gemmataceae bacterium]